MQLRVGAAAGGPGSDSNTHYDARTTHNTCDKSPRVSSRSHMVHSARHAAQRIHTRAKTGPRALNGCPHSAVRHTARHKQPCVATPHAALSAQLMSRWSRTARPHRVRPAREASCHAPLQRRVRNQWNQRGRSSNGGRLTKVAVMLSRGSSFCFLRSGHDRQAQRRPLG